MHVAEIWRYPAKSMAGERLAQTELDEQGIPGDRIFQVRRSDDRIVDARAHPKLLGLRATLDSDGQLWINDARSDSPVVAQLVEDAAAVGPGARLVRCESAGRFDVLPLLVATDGAIAAFGHDARRLRPNIIVGGVEGLAERAWEGRALRIGDVLIGIHSLRRRCVMTTYDPDTQTHDPEVLRQIVRRFDGRLALNCWVIRRGKIRVGDEVELAKLNGSVPLESMFGRYA